MACSKFLQNFRSELLQRFLESFENDNQNSVFIGIGRILPWSRDTLEEIKNPSDSIPLGDDSIIPLVRDTDMDIAASKRNLFFMKQVLPRDISFLVPRYSWEEGTVYDKYRDSEELFDPRKRFFVYNETNRGVYKCLDNNNDSPSSYIPESDFLEPFITNDNYTWKLIYKIPDSVEAKFAIRGFSDLEEYIPIRYIDYFPPQGSEEELQQKTIQDNSLNGSIEFVEINPNFKNFISLDTEKCAIGKETCFVFEDALTGATSVKISTCISDHPPNNSFYLENLVFNVVGETSDLLRRVIKTSELVVETVQNEECSRYINLTFEPPLDQTIFRNTLFNIEPWIRVSGDGTSKDFLNSLGLNQAEFKANFTADNIINDIRVIDSGKNYSYAKAFFQSGITTTNNLTSPEIAAWNLNYSRFLNPILPPQGGHGNNALKELGSSDLAFLTLILGNEENKLTPINDFRQIVLVKNPILNNPLAHLRFSTELSSLLQEGTEIFDSSNSQNSGIVKRIFEYSGDGVTGFEILVEGISGSFFEAEGISFSNTTATIDKSSRFSDHYRLYEIAGTENKSILKLVITLPDGQQAFNGRPRDVVVGIGQTAGNYISPSLASGMIRRLQLVGSSNIELSLENYSGKFNIGEKLLLVPRLSSGVPSLEQCNIIEFRYEKEDSRDIGYSMTTKIEIVSQSGVDFNANSFSLDQAIYSYPDSNTDEETIGSGHLFDFVLESGTTANLEVVGARYRSFQVGDYIPYNLDGDRMFATINKVIEPEVRYDSGEVLYLNNISPIVRNSSNRDQINLVLST